MKTFTSQKRKNFFLEGGGFFKAILFFIAFFAMHSNDLTAQVCCPEFFLKDAVEICPVEGACKGDPVGQSDRALAACKESAHVYTVFPNDPAFTYTWTVTGGTPTNYTGNPNVIVWGTGDVGYIKVVVSDLASGGTCIDSITAQICLIDGPEADFLVDQDTVCENSPVHFTNISLGGSEYLWDFGDGTTSSLPNPPDHSYTAPGTYTVTLTATDMGAGHWIFVQEPPMEMLVPCGCSDTVTMTIVVLPGEGPIIETDCCYGTVCPGEISSFCTPAGCGTYNWTVTGGVISAGAGSNCIEVTWDATYSVPTTVSLETPGCSTAPCEGTTTIHVPVLYPNLPIMGPATLCQGASGTFSLPTLPGTYYTWTVSGGGSQFNQQDRNTPSVNISFYDIASYTVKCEYDNPLAGCSGSSVFTVDVKPEFSIFFGDETVCEGKTLPYYATGPANWSVSPAGPTIIGSGATVNILWNTPGSYTITATPVTLANYCNAIAVKAVEVIALPVLNSIVGADTICPDQNYTYSISSDTDDNPFTWAVSVGSGAILTEMGANNDSIVAKFAGPGPWQLDVYQEIEITPGVFCQSLTETINIYPFSPPSISGPATVCVDAEETYTAGTSSTQEDVEWSIIPIGQGTIQNGQGTNTVDIKWHGPSNTATLTVTTCTGTDTQSVTVNGPPDAVASYDILPIFCLGDAITLNLSTPLVGGYSYQWYKNGTPVGGATSNTLAVNIGALAFVGTYKYHVEVTDNGCTVKSNIIDVVIKNCSSGNPGGGPGPGGCDVVAYFWTYVECDQVTLIDHSWVVPGGGPITGYLWSVTGVGIGTFSPNASDPNPVLTVSASGTYTIKLIVTSDSGCTHEWTETVNILLPTADFNWTAPACADQPISFVANPNNPLFNYEWDFGDGYTSYEAVTEHAYDLASPPDYIVSLTIMDEKGCVADTNFPVTVNPTPNCTITASDTIFCPGSFETLTACAGLGYQWYKDGEPISGANSMTYNVYEHGEYCVEVTNTVGCASKSNEIYMYMNSLPVANITGQGIVCAYPSSTSGVYLTTVSDPDYTYSWSSNPAGAIFSPTTSASTWASVTMPAVLPAYFEFMVDVTDINTGCVNSDTLCVYFFETPTVSVPILNICEGSPVTLTPTPNDPTAYSYQWSNGATTPIIVASAPGHYSLMMTDLKSGCVAYADAGLIFEKPDLSLFPLGCDNICPPDSLHLYIPLPLNNVAWPNSDYPSAYPSITWYDNGDYTSPVGFGETFDFPAAGTGNHEFSVVVQNSFGCVDTAGVFCLTDNEVCCEIIVDWINTVDASCTQSADGSISILLNPASSGGPFTITKTWPLPVQSWVITPGVPFTLSGLSPGGYAFTINDASGECEEFFDVSVGYLQEDCCFAAADTSFIHITAPVTYTSEIVWDNKYFIADGIIVTVDGTFLDITNVDVVFGECAGIEFINGGYLRANNSVFRPCDIDKSWRGLRFDAVGEFDNIVNESTFKNAEVAMYFKDGADAVVSNNLFSNCNYGVLVENNNDFNHPISGNRFVTEDFFPDFACQTKYSFVNNNATYGIYSRAARFIDQVSHNEFVNSKGNELPVTYGVYQLSSGGVFSENTFTDIGTAGYFQGQMYYTGFENNEIEANLQTLSLLSSVYVISCQGPVVDIANNEISNNYSQWVSLCAIYTSNCTNLSIANNDIEGFRYGIADFNSTNHQITNNVINNCQNMGIYVIEQANSRGYITCNSIKMKDYNGSFGIVGYNLSSMSEVSSNCVTDCYTSMNFSGWGWSGNLPVLPLIRNNFLYNYNYVGINVQGYSGNIGTINDPGLNTLWSNNNTATDINSNTSITVADNFGMFNISFPQVQITSNNPYHSTASCGHQIFNMPSQGNLNINYACDNSARIFDPMTGAGGNYFLVPGYQESLKSSPTQFEHANMIMASMENPDMELLNEIIQLTDLTQSHEALLMYNFHYRNADYPNARASMEMFMPITHDEQNYKILSLYDLDAIAYGWDDFSAQDIENMKMIVAEESVHANLAISLLNNVSDHRDHIVDEVIVPDVLWTDNIKRIEGDGSYLNIYPNPVKNTAYIEFFNNTDGNSRIEIFDINGKVVNELSITIVAGGFELDVQQLRRGIYFVTITDPESGFIQKGKLVKVENQ